MKHPAEQIEQISKVIDVLAGLKPNGKSLMNFDAVCVIRKILGKQSAWDNLDDTTLFKRTLKKNGIVI